MLSSYHTMHQLRHNLHFSSSLILLSIFSFMLYRTSHVTSLNMAIKARSSSSKSFNIHWFRHQDLRLHDNPALCRAIQSSECDGKSGLLPVFCIDPRFVGGGLTTSFGSSKCSARRAKFLLESVADLRESLEKKGSGLVVAYGKAEDVFSNLLQQTEAVPDIFCQQEVASEEINVDKAVKRILKEYKKDGKLKPVWGSTLYDLKDLPFPGGVTSMPDVFTPFRNKVEKNCKVGQPLPIPTNSDLTLPEDETLMSILKGDTTESLLNCSLTYMPTLRELGYTNEEIKCAEEPDPRGVMKFNGGETAALNRVQEYVFDKDLLKIYFDTRNGMLGADYSTKFSPWLAHGCLSPRFVAKECRRYEEERGIINKSTYWVVFELLWRDFFKFFALKHGNSIFSLDGTLGQEAHGSHANSRRWGMHKQNLQAWKDGRTGYPLVDANMRELAATGFMSNRGRQNVASFLAIDTNTDWRYGADHFEMHLLDYDVYSNWGNWCSAAGMTGGRLNRFNIVKQSKDYDAEGDYVRHWCPELASLPKNVIHEPWKMSKEQQEEYGVRLGVDYPNPLVPPSRPNPYSGGRGGGDKGGKNRKGSNKGRGGGGNKRGADNPNRGRGQRQDMKSLKEGSYRFG